MITGGDSGEGSACLRAALQNGPTGSWLRVLEALQAADMKEVIP